MAALLRSCTEQIAALWLVNRKLVAACFADCIANESLTPFVIAHFREISAAHSALQACNKQRRIKQNEQEIMEGSNIYS